MRDGILKLNDHCFLEIFKHLSLIDLANFKEIYASLGVIVDMEFIKKTRGSFFFGCRHRMDTALQIIKQFGTSINDLTINYHGWYERKWSEIFAVIQEHCNETLKTLTLCGDAVGVITENDILLLVDILKNLKTLELKNLNYEVRADYSKDFVKILPHCENVESIALISYVSVDANATTFEANKNLSKLKLRGVKDLKAIVDGSMNVRLEEFTISWVNADVESDSFHQNLAQLFRLEYLKRLSIDCCYMNIGPFLLNVDAFHSLNVLSLSNAELELDLDVLGHMTRLKVFKLRHCCLTTKFAFKSIVLLCGQRNFEHLILLNYRDPINEVNFRKLIEQRRVSVAEARLHLTFSNELYIQTIAAIPYELLEANDTTLRLIDGDDPNYEYYTLDRDENDS